jgi:EAL domain-containing protein (putative c-di-GMP-specific phosphodiesterase class I)
MSEILNTIQDQSIALIDDDEVICACLNQHLVNLGARNIEVYHCAKQFASLDNINYNLIIMDLDMPEYDGIQLLNGLSRLQFNGHIILCSGAGGHVLDSAVRLGKSLGLKIIGALGKPFTSSNLVELLSQPTQPSYGQKPASSLSLQDLEDAIRNNRLFPFYQPQICVKTQEIKSVEVLARMMHPVFGLTAPHMFIPQAETLGVMDKITWKIFDQAFMDISNWPERMQPVAISLNISYGELESPEFCDKLIQLVDQHGIDYQRITLEITESQLPESSPEVNATLIRLHLKGFSLSIDDFGTGHSTLSQLQHIPFNELKVDKSFVQQHDADSKSSLILEHCISLGKHMGMRVVAEGVETEGELQRIEGLSCDLAQGFLFSKPKNNRDFLVWAGSHIRSGERAHCA